MQSLLTAPKWRQIQRSNFVSWESLLDYLELNGKRVSTAFPLNLPLRLAQKIQKGNLKDPILLQFLPSSNEHIQNKSFSQDPVSDQAMRRSEKLLHKYQGRALLLCSSACAMHCRYCFRQNYPYETNTKDFDHELTIIQNDPTIKEIILSGGDPLSLSDSRLHELITLLDAIPHLNLLRFHTRFPIGIPERITPEFLKLLSSIRLQTIFVIHINHSNELDADIRGALKKIQRLGIPILTQTVLLKDINDQMIVLKTLFEKLINVGIIPYYLHQLDRVQGAGHFEVPKERGIKLIQELRKTLPGYAVPQYVQEIPGKTSKTQVL